MDGVAAMQPGWYRDFYGAQEEPCFYIITEEQLNRLIEVAIETSNPPTQQSCDWLNELKRSKYGRNPSC